MTFQVNIKYSDGLDYHFFFLNSFTFDKTTESEAEILNDFINSDFFLDDFVTEKGDGNLRTHGPFNVQELKTSDFKPFRPEQLGILIDELIKEDDWGDDLNDFRKLWKTSAEKIEALKMQNGTLFHINKNWFLDSDKQTWDKNLRYTYFMTFVYVSLVEQRIIAFDFGFD